MDLETLAIAHQKTDDRSQRNEARIKKLEEAHDALNKLATSVAVMAERQDTMNHNVETLTEKVDAIENKPAEWWDKLISTILGALGGAFITWIVTGAAGLH